MAQDPQDEKKIYPRPINTGKILTYFNTGLAGITTGLAGTGASKEIEDPQAVYAAIATAAILMGVMELVVTFFDLYFQHKDKNSFLDSLKLQNFDTYAKAKKHTYRRKGLFSHSTEKHKYDHCQSPQELQIHILENEIDKYSMGSNNMTNTLRAILAVVKTAAGVALLFDLGGETIITVIAIWLLSACIFSSGVVNRKITKDVMYPPVAGLMASDEEDRSWYNNDDIAKLLKNYVVRGDKRVEILAALDATALNGNTFKTNLKEHYLQGALSEQADYETLLIPINLRNNHWTLLALRFGDDRHQPQIYYFDPLGSDMPNLVREALQETYDGVQLAAYIISKEKIQQDGYNCGPAIIAAAAWFLDHQAWPTARDIDLKKSREEQSSSLTSDVRLMVLSG